MSPKSTVAIFDLDGTLTWRDTLMPFLAGYLAHRPLRFFRLWRLPAALGVYFFGGRDRGILKARVIGMVMGGDERGPVDAWAERFVGSMRARGAFRPGALAALEGHRREGAHLVLLSASPDLYVPRIGRLLGFERTVCTEMHWDGERLAGTLETPNCRGAEKLRCLERLRSQYPDAAFVAYGNSDADLQHLARADRAVLVNAGTAARRSAASAGIAVAKWR